MTYDDYIKKIKHSVINNDICELIFDEKLWDNFTMTFNICINFSNLV